MANTETEYKFGLPNNWSHFTVQSFDMVSRYLTDIQQFHMESFDYDTEDGFLDKNGHSFRRRRENGDTVYTLKVLREDDGQGKRVRDEYEVRRNCSENDAIRDIHLEACAKSDTQCQELLRRMADISDTGKIANGLSIYRIRDFVRYEYTIQFRDVTIKIAVDVGVKCVGEKTDRIRKIDLEYAGGNKETFEKYVQAFEFITGLHMITSAKVTDLDYDL
ncbi:MAG: CYTH domain-containing protein [Ruminococcus flavefaciens]|nr:CYTH domain-containing protein [Ruminococcus flavefaciens]